jgi:hypothetical protein
MVPNHPLKTALKTSLVAHTDTLGFLPKKTEKTQCRRGLQATYMPVGSRGRVGGALRRYLAQLGQELSLQRRLCVFQPFRKLISNQ